MCFLGLVAEWAGCRVVAEIFEVPLMCCNEPEMRGWVITHKLLECFMWAQKKLAPVWPRGKRNRQDIFWCLLKKKQEENTIQLPPLRTQLHLCVYNIGWHLSNNTDSAHLLYHPTSRFPQQRNSWVTKPTATASSSPSPSPRRPPSCSPTTSPCSSKALGSPCLPTFHPN